MKYRVLRPFPLSLDGLTLIDLNAGDEREDFAGMESGLVAEGYIEPAAAAIGVVAEEAAIDAEEYETTAEKPRRGRQRRG